jgi:hypothetical protein
MVESTAITVSKPLSLTDRIAQMSHELNEWLSTLKRPFNNAETHKTRLAGIDHSGRKFTYRYEVLKRKVLPAARAEMPGGQSRSSI